MSFGLPIDPGAKSRYLISRAFHKNRHRPIIARHAGECQKHKEANLQSRRWSTRSRPALFFPLRRLPASMEAHMLVVFSSRPEPLFPDGCLFCLCCVFILSECRLLQLQFTIYFIPLCVYMLLQRHGGASNLPPTAQFICLEHLLTESHFIWTF